MPCWKGQTATEADNQVVGKLGELMEQFHEFLLSVPGKFRSKENAANLRENVRHILQDCLGSYLYQRNQPRMLLRRLHLGDDGGILKTIHTGTAQRKANKSKTIAGTLSALLLFVDFITLNKKLVQPPTSGGVAKGVDGEQLKEIKLYIRKCQKYYSAQALDEDQDRLWMA